MKTISILITAILFVVGSLFGQKSIPDATVYALDGEKIQLKEYFADGSPKLVSLWATWCGPCKMELKALKDSYPKWKEKYGMEIVTVSVDVPQMIGRAQKMFEANGWDYTFLHDKDQQLMNMLNIRGIPYSMLVDGNGEVVSVQMGYSPGYEKQIEQKLKTL